MRPHLSTSNALVHLVFALSLGVLAACGSADSVTTADDETVQASSGDETTIDNGEPLEIDVDALQASTFTLRFGGGPDGDIPMVDGAPITIFFQGGTFGGVAACNGYGGTYSIDGTSIVLSETDKDDAGCPDNIQASEGAFLRALDDVDGINLVGDELALSGSSTELIFFATGPTPAAQASEQPEDEPETAGASAEQVEGIEWVFAGGDSPDGPIPDPRTIDPTASITISFAEGRYTGTVICNGYGNAAEIGGVGVLSFALGVPEGEEEGCYDELDGIPETYLEAIPQMTEGGLQADGTELVMNGNDIELLFERAE